MSRAQTAVKKGRASSSARSNRSASSGKAGARDSAKSRREGARQRPESTSTRERKSNEGAMAGSKGKGRNRQDRAAGKENDDARQEADQRSRQGTQRGGRAATREMDEEDTGLAPEGNQPPSLKGPDTTVGDQRRASAGQDEDAPTNRPPNARAGKAGSRGGGPVDRDQAESDEVEARQRRTGGGDAMGTGREDVADPTRESTRGPDPKGGEEGQRSRARRAGLGFKDDE